jgi:hypothetical protein
MNNHIRDTRVEVRRLSPAEAEVWLFVEAEHRTPGTELRGKLTGPRCPGATTVEVPYSLRPLSGPDHGQDNTLSARVVIPEPNLWTETSPFVYDARLELWEYDTCAEVRQLTVGLKSPAPGTPPKNR